MSATCFGILVLFRTEHNLPIRCLGTLQAETHQVIVAHSLSTPSISDPVSDQILVRLSTCPSQDAASQTRSSSKVSTYNDINPALSRRNIRRRDSPRLVPLYDLVSTHAGGGVS
jgi:hypothetical protein